MGHFENDLAAVMARKRWTIQALADEIGKHRNTVADFREARRVDLDTFAAICDTLEVNPWDILIWVPDDAEG